MLRSERSVKPSAMFRTSVAVVCCQLQQLKCGQHRVLSTVTGLRGAKSTLKRFGYFLYVMCVCQCEFICTVCVQEPVEAKRGCWIPWILR